MTSVIASRSCVTSSRLSATATPEPPRVIHADAELDQILVGIQRLPIVMDVNRDPRRCFWNKLESTGLHIATIPVGLDGFEKRARSPNNGNPVAVPKG
jgi:hypothetical protein